MLKPAPYLAALALLFATSLPARADTTAQLTTGYLVLRAIDTAQTCTFAPPGARYAMHEQESAWLIGPHPQCGATIAAVFGSALALAALVPHNRFGNAVLRVEIGAAARNVWSNARLMAEFRL